VALGRGGHQQIPKIEVWRFGCPVGGLSKDRTRTRWLLPTGVVVGGCPGPRGVVLVAESINRPGHELNGGGVIYGEPPDSDVKCSAQDEEPWLRDPRLHDLGHTRLGRERDSSAWGLFGTFHPAVTSLHVSPADMPPFIVPTVARNDRPDGPRYVAFSLPADTTSAEIRLVAEDGTVIDVRRRTFG
jgi:hypothetical protein